MSNAECGLLLPPRLFLGTSREKVKLKITSHPYLIGAAVGFIILIVAIVIAIWFPDAPEPLAGMTVGGGTFLIGVLISMYWRFLGSWRLWVTLITLFTIDAVCIDIFFEQVHKLSLWSIDWILALEFAAVILFLNWFLDTKKTHRHE